MTNPSYAQRLMRQCVKMQAKIEVLDKKNNAMRKCLHLVLSTNSEALNGIIRGFNAEAEKDLRSSQSLIKEALKEIEGME